jgi:hypothetical protein
LTNKTLKRLSLSDNMIKNTAPLWHALRTNDSLISLDVSFNPSTIDMQALADMLAVNTSLETLVLDGVDIASVDALGPALAKNRALKSLLIRHGRITSLDALAAGLTPNTALCMLDLSANRIEDVSPFGAMLASNTALENLYLRGNRIRDIGALCAGLQFNTTLKWLSLVNESYSQFNQNDVLDVQPIFDLANPTLNVDVESSVCPATEHCCSWSGKCPKRIKVCALSTHYAMRYELAVFRSDLRVSSDDVTFVFRPVKTTQKIEVVEMNATSEDEHKPLYINACMCSYDEFLYLVADFVRANAHVKRLDITGWPRGPLLDTVAAALKNVESLYLNDIVLPHDSPVFDAKNLTLSDCTLV